MKGYFFTALSGILVWFLATMFFVFFGEYVLYRPGTKEFVVSILILSVGTALLLICITLLYLLFDKSKNAALKFGVIGTCIGLTLDTFSLSFHDLFFSNMYEFQVISFTAWMTFAYALYLLIPTIINERQKRRNMT